MMLARRCGVVIGTEKSTCAAGLTTVVEIVCKVVPAGGAPASRPEWRATPADAFSMGETLELLSLAVETGLAAEGTELETLWLLPGTPFNSPLFDRVTGAELLELCTGTERNSRFTDWCTVALPDASTGEDSKPTEEALL